MTPSPGWLPNALHIRELEAELTVTRASMICALNQLLDLKDLNTGVHATRLAEWAVRIGRDLGLEDDYLHDLEVAAILHDIGKVGVPDGILKKAAPLTAEERQTMQKHSEYGWAVLRVVPGLERVSLIVLHHHESWIGDGYPAGLKGEEIPIGARIISVIDAFDAMVSSRPYRHGLPLDEAILRLVAAAGTQFDATVVERFVELADSEASLVFQATGISLDSAI
jgi:HD-GYP domain-containing protein (c-di-GMP phosphodiesterase class II)